MRIIDSHLHVWDRARAEYAWLGPHLEVIDRSIHFEEIEPTLDGEGVDGVVLVQSADQQGDTDNLLELAAREPRVLGVVAWVPLEDPAEAERRLPALQANPRVVGIRNLVHDRPDPDWVLRPDFDAGLGLLEDAGLTFDFVTADPAALPRLVTVAERHPRLRIVLDHLGKPPLGGAAAELGAWETSLGDVAALPNVFAKVSGLYPTEGTLDQSQLEHVIGAARDAFGTDRLMYGGDWPMSLLQGGYGNVLAGIRNAVADWDTPDQAALWAGTAERFYRLKG